MEEKSTRMSNMPGIPEVKMASITSLLSEFMIKLVQYVWGSYISPHIGAEEDSISVERLRKIIMEHFPKDHIYRLHLQIIYDFPEDHFSSRYPALELMFVLAKNTTAVDVRFDREGEIISLNRYDT